jgi:hypothetical protein
MLFKKPIKSQFLFLLTSNLRTSIGNGSLAPEEALFVR